ncbi:MAG: hypothetical protein R2753_09960 [Chitinophagales bacterium]
MKNFKLTIILFFLLPIVTFSQIKDAQVNGFPIPTLSTSFIRMPSRGASQELDAVYYNPAGVLSLRDGFHLKVENLYQNVYQNQNVRGYKQLQEKPQNYTLNIAQPIFPLFYITYKKNRFAASFFITPALTGGGASAVDNLPFGEYPIADLTALSSDFIKTFVDKKHGTNYSDIKYDYDFDFTGLSYSPTFQLNLAYKVNDYLSLAFGGRLVYSITTAKGGLSNLEFVNESLGLRMSPGNYIRHLVEVIPVGDPEIGNLLADVVDAFPLEPDIDARQTDISFAPIFGVNFNWHNRWYIGVKYEHKTPVTLTTTVLDGKDGSGAYVDGKQTKADIPGVFAGGVTFKPNNKLTLAIGHRLIFYKRTDLGGREEFFTSNYKEFDMAFEYRIMPRFKISAGGTYRTIRAEPDFYNSVDYLVPALTFGTGFRTDISQRIGVEVGFLYSKYLKVKFSQQEEIFGGLIGVVTGEDIYQDLAPILEPFDRKVEYEMTGRAIVASVGVNFWMGSIEENRKGRANRIAEVKAERQENRDRRATRRIGERREDRRNDMLEDRKKDAEEYLQKQEELRQQEEGAE